MKLKLFGALVMSAGLSLSATIAAAQQMQNHMSMDHGKAGHGGMNERQHTSMTHAPMGVMGSHVMPQGKFMLGYRYGHMSMSGLRFGTTDISADYAATTIPNVYFGNPGQPPTLRVIPQEMTMDMHMFSAMYGASDRVTLMAMLPYIEKEMTTITYQGPAGATVLGRATRGSEGVGDLHLGAVLGLLNDGPSRLTFNIGLSLPTGSITKTGQMLTPMNMTPTGRLGYMMQLGSGTVDLVPGLTWQGKRGPLGYGAQLRGVIRLGSNDEGYTLGDEAALSAWVSYKAAPWVSLSGRIEGQRVGRVDGRDLLIAGPAPGANPDYIGGSFASLFAGADFTPVRGVLKGHKIGIEMGVPVYQDLNGPMLKRDWSIALAWRRGF